MVTPATRTAGKEKAASTGWRPLGGLLLLNEEIMKQLLKKIYIWWLNVRIDIARYEMCCLFGNGEIASARKVQGRFYRLINERNALEVQP